MFRSILGLAAVALALASGVIASTSFAATTYSARILGTLRTDGTGVSTAQGINTSGVVVGGASNASGTVVFRWKTNTGMTDEGAMATPNPSYGLAINTSGTLCGFGLVSSSGFPAGLRQNAGGSIQPLPRLAGGGDAYAYGISAAGVSVGWSNAGSGCGSPTCPGNPGKAVAWDAAGSLSMLPDLGGFFSVATDVSPNGTMICGWGANASAQIRAFRILSGVATALPPLPGYTESRAYGVNDGGQVVGYSGLNETSRATLWNGTTPIDLGVTAGALGSIAWKINATGMIVGYVLLPGTTYRATTFSSATPPLDLNTVLDPPSPYTLKFCNGVNAAGQIVGDADSSGTVRGFVLTPTGPVAVESALPDSRLELREPYPNPCERETALRFSLPQAGRVRLDVLDLSGRVVAPLRDAWLPAGDHSVAWDGRDREGHRVRSGVYFARLAEGTRSATKKLIVSR
jgi:probable HAF family extracellular repeat protein